MVWGLGFWVSGFRFRVGGLGFKVSRLSWGVCSTVIIPTNL